MRPICSSSVFSWPSAVSTSVVRSAASRLDGRQLFVGDPLVPQLGVERGGPLLGGVAVLRMPLDLLLEPGGGGVVEEGLADGGLVVKAGAGDFRVPALRSLGGVPESGFGGFGGEPLRLLGGDQPVLSGRRLLGSRLADSASKLPDPLLQGRGLGGRDRRRR